MRFILLTDSLVHNTVSLPIGTMLYHRALELIHSYTTEIFYLLISNSPFFPPSATDNHHSFLHFNGFDYFRNLISVELHCIFLL